MAGWRNPSGRTRWWLVGWLMTLLLLLGSLAALQTRPGVDWLVRTVIGLSGGQIQLGRWEGEWLRDVRVFDLRLAAGKTWIHVDRVRLRWAPRQLLNQRLQLHLLQLGTIAVVSGSDDQPPRLPASLRLPIEVQVERFECDAVLLHRPSVRLQAIAGRASADGHRYRLELERLHSPWGRVQGRAALAMQAPFVLDAHVSGDLGWQGKAVRAALHLDGQLDRLHLRLQGSGQGAPAFQAQAVLFPFAASPAGYLPDLTLQATGVDLAYWLPDAPSTALTLRVTGRPDPAKADSLRIGFGMVNQRPAAIDANGVPLRSLAGVASLHGAAIELHSVQAETLRGRLLASGRIHPSALDVRVQIDQVDLQPIHGRLLPTRLQGAISLSGSPARPRVRGSVRDPRLGVELDVSLLRLAPARARVHRLVLRANGAEASLQGHADLAGSQTFDLEAGFQRFDPARLGRFPAARLNGQIRARGSWLPRPQGTLQWVLNDSMLHQQPLQAQGRLALSGQRLSQADVDLQWGLNRLQLAGSFGLPADRLQLALSAPDLAVLGSGWQGQAQASLELGGAFRAPSVGGTAALDRLATPFALAVRQLSVRAQWPGDGQSSASLQLQATGLQAAGLHLHTATASVLGTLGQHQLHAGLESVWQGKSLAMQLQASGGWQPDTGWQGRLTQWQADGALDARLLHPVGVMLSPRHLLLEPAIVSVAGGVLRLEQTDIHAGRIALQGALRGMALAPWLGWLPAAEQQIQTDMTVDADWSLTYADGWNGRARLSHASGDLRVLRPDDSGAPLTLPLQLKGAQVEIVAEPARWSARAELRMQDFGIASAQADIWPAGGDLLPAAGSVVTASAQLDMPSVRWIGPLLSPQLALGGQLAVQMAASGTFGQLAWSGGLSADRVSVHNPDWGVRYDDGVVRASLTRVGLYISECQLRSGNGSLAAQGELLFGEQTTAARLEVQARQFAAVYRPDLQLVVSGNSLARLTDGRVTLDGNLKADSGFFRFTGGGVPSLSDDVLITGRHARRQKAQQTLPLSLSLVLDLDLGEQLRFEGWGIQTMLSGAVRVRALPGQPLHIAGAVHSSDGRYAAYGQDLAITQGVLAFQGPLDNPALDVIAIREHLPVQPGVHLTGSLQAPRLALIADADIPEHDKLSWLILGRPSAEAGQQKADADLLIAAASALLSRDQSFNMRQQLTSKLGIDEIGLRSRSTDTNGSTAPAGSSSSAAGATQQVVAIGKRLSDRAYLVYEQGVDAASAAVKLTYRMSRSWSVIARAGQESQLDLFWNIWFD